MNTQDDTKQDHEHMMRRDFFNRCCPWIMRKPLKIPLSALQNVPDDVLMQVVPVLRRGWSVQICADGISYKDANGCEAMIPLGAEGCSAALLFDGIRTLEQVAAFLEAERGMAQGSGAPIVREVFLTLAMREAYHPNNPPGSLLKASTGIKKNA
jgi:hypothetical protein